MKPVLEKLLGKGPVLTDGAWGTQLQARGLAPGDFPDLWNLSKAAKVLEVARAYVEAGSDVILTNTFGANRIRLAEAGGASKVKEINREGVKISKQAAGGRALVFASIGPTGKMLLMGDITPEDMSAAFAEQAEALAEAGADALVIESMGDLAEAELAVRAANQTGLPIVACVVFDAGKQSDRTIMGQTPEQVAERLAAAGADVIGFNCGQGIQRVAPLVSRLKAATKLPLWVKPNAGLPKMVDGNITYDISPAEFSEHAREVVAQGADFIGGCCGSTPEFIVALRSGLNTLRAKQKRDDAT